MKTSFHSHFYANFHVMVTLQFVRVRIFLKFSPRCRTKKLDYMHYFESFYSFLNWEGADIRPQSKSGLGKSLSFCFKPCLICSHHICMRFVFVLRNESVILKLHRNEMSRYELL